MVAHLLRRATEELHADGRAGSTPQLLVRASDQNERRFVNILFCGDVVGRPGRDAVKRHVPELRREFGIDLVVVNAENAAADSA